MSGLAEQASRSVIVLHELIAEVFHGDGSKVPELLAHFAPEFTMVTPGGKMLALADVAALFTRLTGRRCRTVYPPDWRTSGRGDSY